MTVKSDTAETAAKRKQGTGAAAGAVQAATGAAARTDVSEEVKYYSKEHQRARRRPFLKFFMLSKFKSHPMLDVRQRSRIITVEGGKNAPRGH